MRAVLPGIPIRHLGRQVGHRRDRRLAARHRGRSVTRVLLAGCGKMGGAMLDGWLDRGLAPADVCVIEPSEAGRAALAGRVAAVVASAEDVPTTFIPDVVVLAVKPQVMDQALPPLARHRDAVFLSIAAGKTIGWFEARLGAGRAIVRSMPNTPAAVRRGITVAVANPHVGAAGRDSCAALLEAVGEVAWVEDEALMDAVTAVSGSGPAYVFLMAECLAAAGAKAGLPADLAMRLARATVCGSGELMRRSSEPAETLRRNVTSPGGTTAAALAVLMSDTGLAPLLDEAIAAATRRSKELAG
ncbi:MAG: pyrroline-5-carboxylate reductase [Alphaproteobacteria bacterium]|nr:pyrroline-5-carboxylate reductase [Alphaproteobacteria bacterium]